MHPDIVQVLLTADEVMAKPPLLYKNSEGSGEQVLGGATHTVGVRVPENIAVWKRRLRVAYKRQAEGVGVVQLGRQH